MKRNKRMIPLAWMPILVIFIVLHGCVRDYGIPTDMSYNYMKAISLKTLQKKIFEGNEQEYREMRSFYGINRLYGFFWDPGERDLILFGEADPEKSTLHFDDFVVSLRNIYCLYCQKEGNTLYYSVPSVTIDPDPYTTNLLNNLNEEGPEGDPAMKARAWQELCMEPQKVGVFGIPFNSHLASIMVNADYLMKDIANGNYSVEIEGGFRSLHQLRRDRAEEAMKNGAELSMESPLNRFEFTAPDAFFKSSENLFIHFSQPVVLITEKEYVSENAITGTGREDALAREFTKNFNQRYREISQKIPVYETLGEAYRVFAIAEAIKESNLVTDTSFFRAILFHYPLEPVFVPTSLPGRSLVDQVTYTTENQFATQYLYSCGGVNLGSKPRRSLLKTMKSNEIMHSIIDSRPSPDAVSWKASQLSPAPWVLHIHSPAWLIH